MAVEDTLPRPELDAGMLYCRAFDDEDEEDGKKLTDAELCDRLLWLDDELLDEEELRWLPLLLLDELKEEPEKLDPDAALLFDGISSERKMMKTAVLRRTAFFI